MALLPTRQRDQILLMVIVLSLGAIGGYFMYMYGDKSQQIATLDTHVTALKTMNDKVHDDIKSGAFERARLLWNILRRLFDIARRFLAEAVATARMRADHVRRPGFRQCRSGQTDRPLQRTVGHCDISPDGIEQLVFWYHPVAIPREIDEKVEDLWFKRNRLAPPAQLAALDVEQMIAELEAHAALPARGYDRKKKSRTP